MTNQEIFDTVAEHLFKQGCRSMWKDTCAYRGEDGKMCAVGVLIPDHLYFRGMDQTLTSREVFMILYKEGIIERDQFNFLSDLQAVHDVRDNWKSSSGMQVALLTIAVKYELDASILSKLKFDNR